MSFEDQFRLSSHAVITNAQQQVLLLRASYTDQAWGLPGGSLNPGETVHHALLRECKEELNCDIHIHYLSGIYYHQRYQSQACIFRCSLADDAIITLSDEHTQYQYQTIDTLNAMQQQRINDCLKFTGYVNSAQF